MYAVYMYMLGGKPVYVGKTSRSITSRIKMHEKEDMFAPYKDATIYYAELRNCAEITIFETLLINNYHPILNKTMVYKDSRFINFDESILNWKIYDGKDGVSIRKKRPNGSGSYTRVNIRDNDYIVFQISIEGKRKSFYGKTPSEAYEKYVKYVHNIDS